MFLKHFYRIRWFKYRRGISVLQAGIKLTPPISRLAHSGSHLLKLSRTNSGASAKSIRTLRYP